MANEQKAKKDQAGSVVGADEKKGILYVVHPVTKKRKAELVREGKVIDAKFMPKP